MKARFNEMQLDNSCRTVVQGSKVCYDAAIEVLLPFTQPQAQQQLSH